MKLIFRFRNARMVSVLTARTRSNVRRIVQSILLLCCDVEEMKALIVFCRKMERPFFLKRRCYHMNVQFLSA